MSTDFTDTGARRFGLLRRSAADQVIADRDMMLRQAEQRAAAAETRATRLESRLAEAQHAHAEAEQARSEAEHARIEAEEARIEAEEARIEAERARTSAEEEAGRWALEVRELRAHEHAGANGDGAATGNGAGNGHRGLPGGEFSFLNEELSSVLRAAEQSAGNIIERARMLSEQQLAESDRVLDHARGEAARVTAWHQEIEPALRSVRAELGDLRALVEEVPIRIQEALAPVADALSSFDERVLAVASIRPPRVTDYPDPASS